MSRKCQHTWIDDESKRHFDLERAPKGIIPNKYRPITYLPYVENLNCTNKKRNMLLACMPWTISEGFLKGKRGTDDLLNIVQHILNKVKRRRKNVAITSIYNKNCLWYGRANLENRISKNVENMSQRHKHHHKSYGKLDSRISCRRKNSNRN